MAITSAIVLYAVIWFLTLFIVLPIRLKTQQDVGEIVPGTPASAPVNPQLKLRALIVTGVAAVIWAVLYTVIETEMLTVRDVDWLNRLEPAPLEAPASE
jgi:predicted secreted protein